MTNPYTPFVDDTWSGADFTDTEDGFSAVDEMGTLSDKDFERIFGQALSPNNMRPVLPSSSLKFKLERERAKKARVKALRKRKKNEGAGQ